MLRRSIRRFIYLGTFVLLGLIAVGGWFHQSARREVALDAAKEQYESAKKASAPQYSPAPPSVPEPPPTPSRPPPPVPTSNPAPPPPPLDAPAIPDFPWPPPKASAWTGIPNAFVLAGATTPTFDEVETRLGRALDAAGYYQRSLFAAPHGFAIVTQLERIEADGAPANASRWTVAETSTTFSLIAYLKRLLYAEPGRYRLVVLVVSDVPFSATGGYMTASDAADLAARGANALPPTLAAERYSPRHRCTALIYEFRKVPNGEPEFVAPSPLQGQDHLLRANIWAALQAAAKN